MVCSTAKTRRNPTVTATPTALLNATATPTAFPTATATVAPSADQRVDHIARDVRKSEIAALSAVDKLLMIVAEQF